LVADDRIYFGEDTGTAPLLKRSGGSLLVRNAADTAYFDFRADNVDGRIFTVTGNGTGVLANTGHLILSSSAGSVIAVSGTLDLIGQATNTGIIDGPGSGIELKTNGSTRMSWVSTAIISNTNLRMNDSNRSNIYAQNAHLILSSSVGSQVTVSGNLQVQDGRVNLSNDQNYFTESGNVISFYANGDQVATYSDSAFTSFKDIILLNSRDINWSGRTKIKGQTFGQLEVLDNNDESKLLLGGDLTGSIVSPNSHLILSSSAGSTVRVSGTLEIGGASGDANLNTTGGDLVIQRNSATLLRLNSTAMTHVAEEFRLNSASGRNVIRGNSGHVILSSSVGGSIVTVSGNLKVTGDIIEGGGQPGTSVGTEGVIIDTFENTEYRTVKYVVSVSSGSGWFQSEEILLMHSGTTSELTEYSIISQPGLPFVGFETSMTGSTVNLLASGSNAENTVKLVRTTIDL
jgi:hypothetical protein